MRYSTYEYEIRDDNDNIIIESFTLKENPKHPEVVEELKAHKVDEFEALKLSEAITLKTPIIKKLFTLY